VSGQDHSRQQACHILKTRPLLKPHQNLHRNPNQEQIANDRFKMSEN